VRYPSISKNKNIVALPNQTPQPVWDITLGRFWKVQTRRMITKNAKETVPVK
jgi:hypothetical protein